MLPIPLNSSITEARIIHRLRVYRIFYARDRWVWNGPVFPTARHAVCAAEKARDDCRRPLLSERGGIGGLVKT